ncbi:TolB family protein [Hyphobacterium sp.]|uniref:TolB family protein n=1 Tax=Hyphobacterium sp. TaxID=2004662 RepID=UPI0037498435
MSWFINSLVALLFSGVGYAQIGAEPWDWNPSVSNDGRFIVFNSERSGSDDDLYVFELETGALVHLLRTPERQERFPTWSPDGEWVIYQSGDIDGANWQIRKIRRDGTEDQMVYDSEYADIGPTYSPDGVQIAFISQIENGQQHVHVMNADGTNVRAITVGTELDDVPGGFGFTQMASWSPDGSRVAFVHGDGESLITDIWTIAVDGTDPIRITDTPDTVEMGPSFNPSGTLIAASSGTGFYQQYILTLHRPDGSASFDLDASAEFHVRPSWMPDGTGIVYHEIIRSGAVIAKFDFAAQSVESLCIPGGWEAQVIAQCSEGGRTD